MGIFQTNHINFTKLSICLFFLGLLSCQEKEGVFYKSKDKKVLDFKNKWLSTDKNFDSSDYKEKFEVYFNEGLANKNYEQSSEALLAVFQVMSNKGFFEDDYYYDVLKKYVADHEPHIFIDHLFSFHIYLGVVETFKGQYKEAIKTLSNLKNHQPYNYSTYADIGYAYYYISCNYYYLGDYLKSMSELNKSLDYFSHTDDFTGQIMSETWKAYLQFTTKNIDEAIITVEKAIKLYENLDDPNNQAQLMLSKHLYIEKDNKELADKYLNEIADFIKKKDIQYIPVLLQYNHLKIKKYLVNKDIKALDELMPIFESQVKQVNIETYNSLYASAAARYQLLKNQKVQNREALLVLLDKCKQNKDYLFTVDILKILKDEAINDKDLAKVIFYDKELDDVEETVAKEELQFKVNVFEKRIDAEKKEKIIAQQQVQISKNKTYILLLVMLLIILALATILYFSRKRKLEAKAETLRQEQFTFQLLQNTEEERSRIAGELHDSVNHDLLTIKNNLINGKLIAVDEVAQVIEEVRNISRNLHPAVFETIGLEASIESLCERMSEVGLFTTCEIEYHQKLSKNKELQLYRIIQEALNNTMKHGKAYAAKVILTSEKNALHLEVKDNGSGFNVNEQLKNPKSFGLQSIMQRAKAIAAKININSTNDGTVILLKIPI